MHLDIEAITEDIASSWDVDLNRDAIRDTVSRIITKSNMFLSRGEVRFQEKIETMNLIEKAVRILNQGKDFDVEEVAEPVTQFHYSSANFLFDPNTLLTTREERWILIVRETCKDRE